MYTAASKGSLARGQSSCSMQNKLQLSETTPRTGFNSLFIARLAAGSWWEEFYVPSARLHILKPSAVLRQGLKEVFLHFCGVWPRGLICSPPAQCFPSHVLPKQTTSFVLPAQGLRPSPSETQALSKGPGCPQLCPEPLISHRLQRATSRSWCFGLSYTKQHNQVCEKLLPDCKLSFNGAANARASEQMQQGPLSLQRCIWADWLRELKGSLTVLDTFVGDFQV